MKHLIRALPLMLCVAGLSFAQSQPGAAAPATPPGSAAPAPAPGEAMPPPGPRGPHLELPSKFTNLKVLPKKISKDDLLKVMREMGRGLGQRCGYCHEMGAGHPDFAKDTDTKQIARQMMKMTAKINKDLFTWKDAPRATCYMCHRGAEHPQFEPPPMPAGAPGAGPAAPAGAGAPVTPGEHEHEHPAPAHP